MKLGLIVFLLLNLSSNTLLSNTCFYEINDYHTDEKNHFKVKQRHNNENKNDNKNWNNNNNMNNKHEDGDYDDMNIVKKVRFKQTKNNYIKKKLNKLMREKNRKKEVSGRKVKRYKRKNINKNNVPKTMTYKWKNKAKRKKNTVFMKIEHNNLETFKNNAWCIEKKKNHIKNENKNKHKTKNKNKKCLKIKVYSSKINSYRNKRDKNEENTIQNDVKTADSTIANDTERESMKISQNDFFQHDMPEETNCLESEGKCRRILSCAKLLNSIEPVCGSSCEFYCCFSCVG